MSKRLTPLESATRRGAWMAALVSGVLALGFAILFMSWSAIAATAEETRMAAMLAVSAGVAGAITGGCLWRLMVAPGSRHALLQAGLAGIVTVPLANLAMWVLFFTAAGVLGAFSDPRGLLAAFGSGSLGPGTIYLAFASTMLTGMFTVPLSVAGLIGVTLWCRRKLDEAPAG